MTKILLAEDDDSLRGFLARALERAGYEVRACADGDEAMDALPEGEWDLLLTDIVMPARSGIELAAEVERRAPGVSVVYMSGYSEDVHGDMPTEAGIFVAKPFDAQVLLESIDAALGQRTGETAANA